ncbi:hypothetical protein AB434_1200 [Heyndrickxia coagulans]|nr:hypothetical protein AB434_1200 [Heyndrickxia coagulans]KYC89321.1 hypothetical protein B4096_1284 [Heyndrickxia coagulans]
MTHISVSFALNWRAEPVQTEMFVGSAFSFCCFGQKSPNHTKKTGLERAGFFSKQI